MQNKPANPEGEEENRQETCWFPLRCDWPAFDPFFRISSAKIQRGKGSIHSFEKVL